MMEGCENTNINFAYLLNSDPTFISANVSKAHAFSICADAVEQGQVTPSEVLALWMNKLRIVYNFENFCEVDWRRLTLCCQNYFDKFVYSETDVDGTYCQLRSWLEASTMFLEQLHTDAKKIHLTGICLFLQFILGTVQKSCTFFRINGSKVDWKSQLGSINTLHNCSLKLVWDSLECREKMSSMDYCAIVPFINMVCLNITQDSFIDIKTKIEAWKYVTKFTVGYVDYKKVLGESHWPQLPMSVLIHEVERNILAIYKKELKEDVQNVEQYLRVTGFYLRILHKMTTVFQHSDFPVAKDFFDILLLAMTAPSFLRKSNVFVFVKKHVLSGLTNVLHLVFKNSELQQLVSNHVGESKDVCFDLVMAYLRACISNDNLEISASHVELFIKIFKRLLKGGDIFVDADHFDEMIDIYTVLTLLDSKRALHRSMQQYVLKGNSALSFACTEVLILASCCLDEPTEQVTDKLVFWVQTKNRFARFSSNFRRLNIERLIAHYFRLCAGKIPQSKNQIQLAGRAFSLNNCSVLRYITDDSNKPALESSKLKVNSKLCRLMEEYEHNGMHIEDYYEIAANMYELMICKAEISKDLQQKIADLLVKSLKTWMKNSQHSFDRLLSVGLRLMATCNITDEMQLKVLGLLKDAVASGIKFPMVAFWRFLEVCCNQQKPSKVCNVAQSILTNIEVPEIIQVSIFEKSSQFTSSVAVDSECYTNIENNSRCTICTKSYFVQRKRPRREFDSEECDFEEIIHNVSQMVKKIHDFSKHLKISHVKQLNNVCIDIKKITDNHKNET
ncbi:uncharacterized protein LOC128866267 [Anastrepha ludens]|uniref:uncharacterized protein LOC128866267 n=1 Tax=Anastrepha ludens TaxID=28586 RepID=UPI0023AF7408|nr:uncharacterized protein LOC128866267 [Anastrepha ludens]